MAVTVPVTVAVAVVKSPAVPTNDQIKVDTERERASFLSSLPLLSDSGLIIFQVPGGEAGWSDVTRAISELNLGFIATTISDERGVKRVVVLRRP